MKNGYQLAMKKEPGHSARAVFRIYGEETIRQMNEIAEAQEKRPSLIVQEWIDDVWRQMVATGEIRRDL